jgi:hypothetical protein
VNLAWWPAWTSNPVVVHRKVGWVGSIPMHLRHFIPILVYNSLVRLHAASTCAWIFAFLSNLKRRIFMGDRKSKKDKSKNDRQKANKLEKQKEEQKNKQPKKSA